MADQKEDFTFTSVQAPEVHVGDNPPTGSEVVWFKTPDGVSLYNVGTTALPVWVQDQGGASPPIMNVLYDEESTVQQTWAATDTRVALMTVPITAPSIVDIKMLFSFYETATATWTYRTAYVRLSGVVTKPNYLGSITEVHPSARRSHVFDSRSVQVDVAGTLNVDMRTLGNGSVISLGRATNPHYGWHLTVNVRTI